MFSDELVHTMEISKPALVFLSPKTYKAFYTTVKTMEFVKNIILYGTEISEPNVVIFKNLISTKVDINLFKTDSFDGKLNHIQHDL